MTRKVVSLKEVKKRKKVPDYEIVHLAKTAMSEAKKGTVEGMLLVTIYEDGRVGSGWHIVTGVNTFTMLGAIDYAKEKFIKKEMGLKEV